MRTGHIPTPTLTGLLLCGLAAMAGLPTARANESSASRRFDRLTQVVRTKANSSGTLAHTSTFSPLRQTLAEPFAWIGFGAVRDAVRGAPRTSIELREHDMSDQLVVYERGVRPGTSRVTELHRVSGFNPRGGHDDPTVVANEVTYTLGPATTLSAQRWRGKPRYEVNGELVSPEQARKALQAAGGFRPFPSTLISDFHAAGARKQSAETPTRPGRK